MDNSFVESITASLVREYLNRKQLRTTLATMDEEMPRNTDSISNRQELQKLLRIEKLCRRNKEQKEPLKAMLEVVTCYFLEKAQQGSRGATPAPSRHHSKMPTETSLIGGNGDTDVKKKEIDHSDHICQEPIIKLHGKDSSRNVQDVEEKTQPEFKKESKKQYGDLIIEDSIESETFLGDGKSGIFDQKLEMPTKPLSSRPRSAARRGMAAPISSNVDDRDRRRQPRKSSARPSPSSHSNADLTPSSVTIPHDAAKPEHKPVEAHSSAAYVPQTSYSKEYSKPLEDKRTVKKSIGDGKPISDVLNLGNETTRPRSSRRRSGDRLIETKSKLDAGDHLLQDPVKPQAGRRISKEEEKKYDPSYPSTEKREGSASSESSRSNRSRPVSANKVGDVEIGDIDDLESDLGDLALQTPVAITTNRKQTNITDSKPIDIQTAIELKTLIFGSASQSFNEEWSKQCFAFCDFPGLEFGIVQHKGGSCGVLAAIQACMLQQLLFGEDRKSASKTLNPSRELRSECLALAISTILWRAGSKERAVVAIPSGRSIFHGGGRYKPDGLTETLVLNHFNKFDDLKEFMSASISHYELDGNSGVILMLYSVLLTRTIEDVRSDMDDTQGKLMGAHGYCTQEMVNLLLTGHAASNVFNDEVHLDSGGNGPAMVLKGVQGRSDVGLLSLFEHYKSCQVGTYLKTPKYPIWVICSESHFSVLFCTKKELMTDWRAERRFDLYYYDGLGKQQEQIKLTIDTSNRFYEPPSDDELVPPIELCIRTKWNDAMVDWNGSEPLL